MAGRTKTKQTMSTIRRIIGGRSSAVSTVLNVVGMAMAFAAMYIIMVQVNYDLGYNKGFKDSERIFAIGLPDWYTPGNWMSSISRPIGETVTGEGLPFVECGGTVSIGMGSIQDFYREKDHSGKIPMNVIEVSSGALETFSFEAVEGSLESLETGDMAAISQSKSKELGLKVGDVFYSNSRQLGIVAVFRDFPKNSDFYGIDIIRNIGERDIENTSEWSYPYFVKLHSAEDKEEYEKQAFAKVLEFAAGGSIEELTEEELEELRSRIEIKAFCIEDTYFERSFGSPGMQGNSTTTYTLLAIAILVIVIAFINFINFFFALVPVRMKSVNTKKILGASRGRLAGGFVGESVVMVAVALAIAAGCVKLFCGSSLASLLPCDASVSQNVTVAVCVAVSALAIAALSSLYPALYITSFSPAFALKGSFYSASKGKYFRYGLIGFQFTVSICLIICACFVSMQREYMLGHDMGFDRSCLLETTTTAKIAGMTESVSSKLKENPSIKDVTWANGSIVSPGRMGWGREFKGERINFECYPVTWNFLRVMGIDIVEGRDFEESDELCENGVFVFNEAAKDKFGLTLEDRINGHNGETEIAGFCRNFNFKGLSSSIEPFALYIFGKYNWKINNTLYVRTTENADMSSVIGSVKDVLYEMDPSIAKDEVDVRFFDSRLDSIYRTEKRLSQIILLFTILAIAISLMGVFGLVMFEAEYRQKEIGIRRVNGATVGDILKMFNLRFIKIVLVCFVIAMPVSWLISDTYLKGFAYRMDMHWWVFAIALGSVLAVTAVVVTARCFSAAIANPVKSLKSE